MAENEGLRGIVFPEEKLARRFLQAKRLVPPIDVWTVAAQSADIREELIPGTIDAILLGANTKRRKPLILLQASASPARKIFTLAHELGHIIIPWHIGTFVCHTDFHVRVPNYIYVEIEAEANRFASEVLMPSDWIQALIKQNLGISRIVQSLQATHVSALAASLALRRNLPTGYVFAEVTHQGEVRLSGKTKDTHVEAPDAGTQITDAEIHSVAPDPEVIRTPSGFIYWWHLKPLKRGLLKAEIGDSRDVLKSIFSDLSLDAPKRTKLMQTINGIIGSANGKARSIKADIYTVLKGRFLGRPELDVIIRHPDFESFLIRKAEELELR